MEREGGGVAACGKKARPIVEYELGQGSGFSIGKAEGTLRRTLSCPSLPCGFHPRLQWGREAVPWKE